MTPSKTITIFQGNTDVIPVSVKDGAGLPFPLVGYTCVFMVKKEKEDTEELFSLTADPAQISENVVTFLFSSELTSHAPENYYYEILVSQGISIVKTVAQGVFTILDSLNVPNT